MIGISTASMYQSALLNINNAQQSEVVAEQQTGSGKVADDLEGYGTSAATLTATNSLNARVSAYLSNGTVISGKLSTQDQMLTSLSSAAQAASTAISTAIGTNDGTGLMSSLQSAFSQAEGALNAQYNGQYLFAGGQVDTQPLSATSMSDLAGLDSSTISSVFQNDQNAPTNRLDDSTVATTGFLASDIGTPLMSAMADFATYVQNNGEPTGTLTTDQASELQGILGEFTSAVTSANATVAQNGNIQNQVNDVQTSLTNQQNTLQNVIGNLTDVNVAQVATNLTLAQTALQASAQVFSSLQSDSLLNLLKSG